MDKLEDIAEKEYKKISDRLDAYTNTQYEAYLQGVREATFLGLKAAEEQGCNLEENEIFKEALRDFMSRPDHNRQ